MPDRPLRIKRWNTAWRAAGDTLLCTLCLRGQSARDAYRPFVHGPDCTAATAEPQHPWLELSTILISVLKDDKQDCESASLPGP